MGSNLCPERHLPLALEQLRERLEVVAVSRVYRSPAVGSAGSPAFCNLAVRIATRIEPLALKLEVLRPIEARLGRVRTDDPNAPRTLDLDLALYGARVVDDPARGLVLPDPEILTRAHVALPLAEIVPDFVHPVDGRPIAEIAARFVTSPGVEILQPFDSGKDSAAGTTAGRGRHRPGER